MNLRLVFRIFYNSLFTILNIVLIALLLITPADAIRQALNNHQIPYVFVVAGVYFFTLALAILIYASRLYTNRTVLASIPRTWIPVEKGDVNRKVRKMIVASLTRSAAIAWDSRPRIPDRPATVVSESANRVFITRSAEEEVESTDRHRKQRRRKSETEKDEQTVTIPPDPPVWGEISHNGWSSPTSPDLPNLQYTTVILELPHLIEARAVSLAPQDLDSGTQRPMPDVRVVGLLQRPASMGLRDYVGYLISVGVVTAPATSFLAAYEYARFSSRPLSETQFRDLMSQFAEFLRNMTALSPATLASLDIDLPDSDIDDDVPSSTTSATSRSRSLASLRNTISRSGSEGTIRTAPLRRVVTNETTTNLQPGFITAPATPRSKKHPISRSPSGGSFAPNGIPYGSGYTSSSNSSLRSASQGSVIKLSRTNDSRDLPYTLMIPGT